MPGSLAFGCLAPRPAALGARLSGFLSAPALNQGWQRLQRGSADFMNPGMSA